MNTPFLELRRESKRFQREIQAAVCRVTARGRYILGPEVEALEKEFAEQCDIPFAVGVGTGTDALVLALESSGVITPGAGDEVITPALSSGFTALSIYLAGAVPRFVDVDPRTLQIDAKATAAEIGPRTRAILPVHLYGNAYDVEAIRYLADHYHLALIEDACQAHGSRWRGKLLGTLGAAGCFSFYPTKNLGALGDGGMLVTHDEQISRRARSLRHGGQIRIHYHELLGRNSRLDEIQAAILRFKLQSLETWNQARRRIADHYNQSLADLDLNIIQPGSDTVPNRHLYVIRCPQRDRLADFLSGKGIETLVHYPVPVPHQPAFQKFLLPEQEFPAATAAAREILSLPLYPELKSSEQEYIVSSIRSFFGK